jgi:hypothetical protein
MPAVLLRTKQNVFYLPKVEDAEATAEVVARDRVPTTAEKEKPPSWVWTLEGETACPVESASSLTCAATSADGKQVVTFTSQELTVSSLSKFTGVYRYPLVVRPQQDILVHHPVRAHCFCIVDQFHLHDAARFMDGVRALASEQKYREGLLFNLLIVPGNHKAP